MEHLSAQFQVIFSLLRLSVMAFLDKKGTIQSHYYVRCTSATGLLSTRLLSFPSQIGGLGHVCASRTLGQQKSHIKCFASALVCVLKLTGQKTNFPFPQKVHSTLLIKSDGSFSKTANVKHLRRLYFRKHLFLEFPSTL